MKATRFLLGALLLLLCGTVLQAQPSLVPKPAQATWGKGKFTIQPQTTIAYGDKALQPAADYLASSLQRLTGVRPKTQRGGKGDILLQIDRKGVKGEGRVFYGAEEAIIAYNEGRADLHAIVKCMVDDLDEQGNEVRVLKETTIGRILFNQVVPKEVGYINEILTKRSLRDIIAVVMKKAGADKVAAFLDDIKAMGYQMAFQGGLSFNLDAVIIPEEKEKLVQEGYCLLYTSPSPRDTR